jgi:hypothetical protein
LLLGERERSGLRPGRAELVTRREMAKRVRRVVRSFILIVEGGVCGLV